MIRETTTDERIPKQVKPLMVRVVASGGGWWRVATSGDV